MSNIRSDMRGLIVTCGTCGTANRLAYATMGQAARCGKCKSDIGPPAAPFAVGSSAIFDVLVAESRLPVLVDFWADWCGPCKVVAPQLEMVAQRNAGRLLVAKVDTEAVPDLSARLGIRSIPTLSVYDGGQQAATTAGAMPAERIEAFVREAVGVGN